MTVSIRTPDEAIAAALATHTNKPGYCQEQTHEWYNAPSAGDVDHDGDADAIDGWESEPKHARHPGDRDVPDGYPVAYSGGSEGHGHRAMTVHRKDGAVMIRSTDAGGEGVPATVPLDWPEREWGLRYLGWSETIDGNVIPPNPAPKPTKKPHKPTRVDQMRALGEQAEKVAKRNGNDKRAGHIGDALDDLPEH